MIPTASPSPHHHHTTPHLYGSTIINHHTTTTKMLLPLIIHITQLENPNLFQQARSHWWTQRNSWTQTPSINPNHNRKKKKKRKRKTQFNPNQNPYTVAARSIFPPSLINPDQPPKSHRNKNPDIADQPQSQPEEKKKKPKSTPIKTQTTPLLDQRFLHHWSTQINHQNPTGTKTQTPPINPDHNKEKKKKKKPISTRSKPRHRRHCRC